MSCWMGLITGLEEKEKENKKGMRNQHKLLRKQFLLWNWQNVGKGRAEYETEYKIL